MSSLGVPIKKLASSRFVMTCVYALLFLVVVWALRRIGAHANFSFSV